jgi:hypothetical protein
MSHFFRLGKVFQQLVDITHFRAAAACDPPAPAGVHDFRMAPLLDGHAADDSLGLFQILVPQPGHPRFDAGGHVTSTRQHFKQILQRTHLLYLLELGQKIVEVQFAFQHPLLHPGHFLLIECALRFFDQADHIAHAQNPRGHPLGIKRLQVFRFLTRANEQDGTTGHGLYGKRRAAARVAVQLSQN